MMNIDREPNVGGIMHGTGMHNYQRNRYTADGRIKVSNVIPTEEELEALGAKHLLDGNPLSREDLTEAEKNVFNFISTDGGFIRSGRNISEESNSMSGEYCIILNETLAEVIRYSQEYSLDLVRAVCQYDDDGNEEVMEVHKMQLTSFYILVMRTMVQRSMGLSTARVIDDIPFFRVWRRLV